MPKTKVKYKAKPVFWNKRSQVVELDDEIEDFRRGGQLRLPSYIHRFDSQHEFKVYLELVRMYGNEYIKPQCPIELIKPNTTDCYPRGKYWKVDFAIMADYDKNLSVAFAEAKGAILPEFVNTLVMLEINTSILLESLTIVFPDRIPIEIKIIKNLMNTGYENNLLTLSQLQKKTLL